MAVLEAMLRSANGIAGDSTMKSRDLRVFEPVGLDHRRSPALRTA